MPTKLEVYTFNNYMMATTRVKLRIVIPTFSGLGLWLRCMTEQVKLKISEVVCLSARDQNSIVTDYCSDE